MKFALRRDGLAIKQKERQVDIHEETIALRADPDSSNRVAKMWFELAVEEVGWAALYCGVDGGSRPCAQTLRLRLTHVYDPLPDLAVFAEHAHTGDLPFVIEIESEGPVSCLTIRESSQDQLGVFEVRDAISPTVYFAAKVDPRQVGLALAHALRVAIADPSKVGAWEDWYTDDVSDSPRNTEFFGSDWLRALPLEKFERSAWYFDGIETFNGTHYPRTRE